MAELFDVVAVRIDTRRVRVMDEGQDRRNADAYVKLAVMRRGVETEIFSVVPAGSYKEGDQWTGNKMEEKHG